MYRISLSILENGNEIQTEDFLLEFESLEGAQKYCDMCTEPETEDYYGVVFSYEKV